MQDRYLVISDTQMPFEALTALEYCYYIKQHFGIPNENVLHVGDEVDEYFGSLYKKDPDATHTPTSEIKETKDKIKRWASLFPLMRICESNHGMRWAKRAAEAEIPSQMMRRYQDVLETPLGWRWQRVWHINASKKPFIMKHGMEYSGVNAYRNAAIAEGKSVVFGHLHSSAGIAHVKTDGLDVWGMNVGCLIDVDAYAFHYGKYNKFKPNLGVGVILDGGTTPIWLPYSA